MNACQMDRAERVFTGEACCDACILVQETMVIESLEWPV